LISVSGLKIEYKNGRGFVMENRLFLLYFPGYYDGDEIIGIYDDISKLKASYEHVISNPADGLWVRSSKWKACWYLFGNERDFIHDCASRINIQGGD
jgi:hypothetical protein